ncbi:MAG: hypothetical protein JJ863_11785 [Deltaproteobacteria bacterium]|nr:hypothetical protein [Deltaproteobacteria bacterium]
MRFGMLRCLSWAVAALALTSSCGDPDPDSTTLDGVWVGVLETGSLPSGSNQITVDVESAEIGMPVVATVVFGEGAAPPPPTDPDLGWPMGVDPNLEAVPVADGYVYPSHQGTRTGNDLQIDVAVTELWDSWCALQTPYSINDTTEAQCLPNRPWDATPFECMVEGDAENPDMPVDCLKLTLCRRTRVCTCTTTDGCVPSTVGLTLEIDLTIDGDEALGTIRWVSEDPELSARTARIRLTR